MPTVQFPLLALTPLGQPPQLIQPGLVEWVHFDDYLVGGECEMSLDYQSPSELNALEQEVHVSGLY